MILQSGSCWPFSPLSLGYLALAHFGLARGVMRVGIRSKAFGGVCQEAGGAIGVEPRGGWKTLQNGPRGCERERKIPPSGTPP